MKKRKYIKKCRGAFIILMVMILLCGLLSPVKVRAAEDADEKYSKQVFESLANKQAGVMDGTPHDQIINAKIKGAKFSYFKSFQDVALALQQKKVDYYITPDITFGMMKKNFPDLMMLKAPFVTLDVGTIMPKNSKQDALLMEFNAYIKKIKENGELNKLVDYWLHSDREDAYVDIPAEGEKGILHMATTTSLEPFSYQKDGKIVGYDIAIVTGFCRENGYGLIIDDMDFAGVLAGIASAKYDLGSCCIAYTEERAESVRFFEITFTQSIYPVVRKADYPELIRDDTDMDQNEGGNHGFWESIKHKFISNFITENRWKLILSGIGVTVLITLSSIFFGSLLGFALCLLKRCKKKVFQTLVRGYIWIFQGTPVVILLMIFYYVIFGNSDFPAILVAIIAFSLNFAAYAADIFSTGINTISNGQREAALVLGYTETESFFHFVLPQAFRVSLPVYKSQIISLLKGTSIVGYIAIQDLTKVGDIIRSRTFEPFFPLFTAAALYFILAYIMILLLDLIADRCLPKRVDPRKRKLLKGVKIDD